MQKKIIALAVAGLVSGAAFAQSNVTVYGVMDLGEAWVKTSNSTAGAQGQGNVGRLDSNSSNIGFKGVEDLGGGMKALFQLETGFNGDAAVATNLGSRDTYVGLTGGFGTVVAGTLTHPLRAFGNKAEVMPGGAGIGTMHSVYGTFSNVAGAQLKTGADERATNAIAYVSPNFSGFTGTVAYVNGETKTNAAGANVGLDANAWQVAGEYANGPLNAGLGYHDENDFGKTAGAAHQNAKVWRGFVTYDFGVAKVGFLYDNTKVDGFGQVSGQSAKRNAYGMSVMVPFGVQAVGLQYARSGDIKRETGSVNETDSNIFAVVYTYALSKRTMVHARYSKLSNGDAAGNTFYNNAVANTTAYPGVGSDSTGYMVGLRHSF